MMYMSGPTMVKMLSLVHVDTLRSREGVLNGGNPHPPQRGDIPPN